MQQVDGSLEMLHDLIALFQQECPKLMEEIHQAIANGDAQRLQRAAHTLKGSIGIFAAAPAFEAAKRLESLGRGGDLSGAAAAQAALDHEIERLMPALHDLTASKESSNGSTDESADR